MADQSTPPSDPPPPPPQELPKDVAEEKTVIPPPPPSAPVPAPTPAEHKTDDSKALVLVEKVPEAGEAKSSEGSVNRDAVLAKVATEKRVSLIKAWEESEKSKAENKAHKKLSSVVAWENSRKASVEAELKRIEENLEKKKAEYIEKMKNKIALLHKEAEEKRAIIEAKRGEELLKAEETAAKYRATGTAPKKLLSCFSS
ncbi:hypothetical protein SDJN02_26408 [Cucurbita argyrosperma subsp. argyrosperma]|nr:hypothetical protein SDJN02_26408 [Cucurbita argyrosperma subsp. argyrosperma]